MYEEITKQIKLAELQGQKIAMFHLQVLKNAEQLDGVDAVEFCRKVGMKDSFATEYRKMVSLAKLMKQQGIQLT